MKRWSIIFMTAFICVACAIQSPLPTSTPIPTDTVVPTSTPTPLPTITPTPTPDLVSQYEAEIFIRASACNDAFNAFYEVQSLAQGNDYILFSDEWISNVKTTITDAADKCSDLGAITNIPDSYKTSQGYLEKAAAEIIQARDDYIDGLDKIDAEKIGSAGNHLGLFSTYMEMATKSKPE